MDWVDWPFRAVREDKSNVTDQKPVKLSNFFAGICRSEDFRCARGFTSVHMPRIGT